MSQDPTIRAAEIQERGRLEAVLLRVLPRVGVRTGSELLQRLAVELRREGCTVRHVESARARARRTG